MKKLVAICFLWVVAVFAETPVHDGFFLNMQLGYGLYGTTVQNNSSNLDSYNSLATNYSMKFGGALTPHLVLYGTFAFTAGFSIDDDYDDDVDELNALQLFIGPGILFIPCTSGPLNNFFIGLAAGPTIEGITSSESFYYEGLWEDDSFTGYGFAVQLEVGKEWWVSKNWSLGIVGTYRFNYAQDEDYSSIDWHTNVFLLQFTISRS